MTDAWTGTDLALALCLALTLINLASLGLAALRIGGRRGASIFPARAPEIGRAHV